MMGDDEGKRLLRRSRRALGCLIVLLALIGGCSFLLAPERECSIGSRCASNIRQVAVGLLMYSNDWDERLPRNMYDAWPKPLGETPAQSALLCPKLKQDYPDALAQVEANAPLGKPAIGYAFLLPAVNLAQVTRPADEVMVSDLPAVVHCTHSGDFSQRVAYADGHARSRPADRARYRGSVRWLRPWWFW